MRSALRSLYRYAPYVVTATAATLATGALCATGFSDFGRFLGPLPPVLTVAGAGVLGLGALRFLEGRGFWRTESRSRALRGLAIATVAAIPFAAIAISVDVLIGFPRDINVGWPEAWLFYPAIAMVAETAFHLLPLTGLVWVTRSRFVGRDLDRRTWGVIIPVALVEPAAQVALGSTLPAFVMPQVFLIGMVQLILLRRYGYLSMIWLRVFYYLLWHVLWGEARLALLF